MKHLLSILALFLFLTHGAFAVNIVADSITDSVQDIQDLSGYVGTIPGGGEPKGFVGQVLANIFYPTGLIKTEVISAFQSILGLFSNNIPKWDGGKFVEGTIFDVGGRIGIGTDTPQGKLHINTTNDASLTSTNHGLTIGDTGAKSLIIDNNEILARDNGTGANLYIQGSSTFGNTIMNTDGGNVGIGTGNPQTKLHVFGISRFDGGVQIDGKMAISNTNYSHRAQATSDDHYGFFEVRNNTGTRGAYFGYGNGSDRVNLSLDAANKLYITGGNGDATLELAADGNNTGENNNPLIKLTQDGGGIDARFGLVGADGELYNDSIANATFISSDANSEKALQFVTDDQARITIKGGGNVGIGVSNPSTKLHVDGKIIADAPTANNHVATKGYVDQRLPVLECVTLGRDDTAGGDPSVSISTQGNTFSFSEVGTHKRVSHDGGWSANVSCSSTNGWIMLSCASVTYGGDHNDTFMYSNSCRSDEQGQNTIKVRCCKTS